MRERRRAVYFFEAAHAVGGGAEEGRGVRAALNGLQEGAFAVPPEEVGAEGRGEGGEEGEDEWVEGGVLRLVVGVSEDVGGGGGGRTMTVGRRLGEGADEICMRFRKMNTRTR